MTYIDKWILLSIITSLSSSIQAQYCTNNNRFTEKDVFTVNEIDSVTNVIYATALDYQANLTDLEVDIYFPNNIVDTFNLRPFILMIHGGGFVAGDKGDRRTECITLAKKGYVAATINYRLGWTNSIQQIQAIYRAHQDALASLRYFVSNSSAYKIDTNWIFIGGSSAGAITANNIIYMSQADWNNQYPWIQGQLGTLDTSGNSYTNTFNLNGIFNNWGGVSINSIQPSEMIPQIAFHGELDPTVDIDSGTTLIGSRVIHSTLINNGICSNITIDTNGLHGIYTSSVGSIFRAEKASCFFKSIFCNDCQSMYTIDSIPANCSSTLVSIEETNKHHKVTAYPNPVHNFLYLEGVSKSSTVTIYNSAGKEIRVLKNANKVNFSNLHKGIYFVEIVFDSTGKRSTLKIVKE